MLKDQIAVSQKFNSTDSIVNFNKRNNPQINGFVRKKNFDAPSVDSKRGDIFGNNNQTKNVVKPTLYINNSTRKTTGADLANVRPSFRKSNPVRYYSDFTIISALENAHRAGKFHLDVGSIDRLKDYLRDNDKEPNKNIDNIPDITPTPKIIPYNPSDSPMPAIKKPIEIPDSDPGILPTPPPPSNWKGKLWTAAKWTAVLAALGITYKLAKDKKRNNVLAGEALIRLQDRIHDDDEFGIEGDGDEFEDLERILQQPSATPAEEADLRYLFPEPSAPPAEKADLRYLFPEPSAPPAEDDYFETGDYKTEADMQSTRSIELDIERYTRSLELAIERKHDTAALTKIMGEPEEDGNEEFKEIFRVSELEEKKIAPTSFDDIINDTSLSTGEKSERVLEAVTRMSRGEPQLDSEEKKYISINSDGNKWNDPLYVRNEKLKSIIERDIEHNDRLNDGMKAMLLSEFVKGRPKRNKLISYIASNGESILKAIFNHPQPPSPPPPPKRRGLARKGRAT